MRRLALEHPDLLRQMIRSEIADSPSLQQLHRLHCVLLVGNGQSCCDVGRWFGHSARTVERWFGVFIRTGLQGLRPGHSSGRHSCLPAELAQGLHEELTHSPAGCGYAGERWSGPLLRQHLLTRHGLSVSLRQCQRLLQHEAQACA
jgi:transposase